MHSALRRSTSAIALTLALFGLYDYLVWQGEAVLGFYLVRFFASVVPALIPSLIVSFKKDLKSSSLPFLNLVFLFGPWLGTIGLVLMAPSRSRQYMMTLAYFQIWSGYTMLSLPSAVLVLVQVFQSVLYALAEYWVEHSTAYVDSLFRPDSGPRPPTCETGQDLSVTTMVLYLIAAQLLGAAFHKRRRRNLKHHANLMVNQEDRMQRITSEMECCERLMQNIFPPSVFIRLQEKAQDQTTGENATFAEKFTDCTFLFAKIVGLKQVTELGESGKADPQDVVQALQVIFDRFDGLADTFKVQKVRKTVNEYYMVAAGLPDPTVLPAQKERALALVSLAFSMVHIMDVINTDPVIQDIGVELSCQVGIHSGDAIAGVIGQKRFQYDLCGDAVNTAARMCSYSTPGCITVSPTTFELVRGEYGGLYRGEKQVKGKGNMKLYYLTQRLHPGIREQLQAEQDEAVAKAVEEATQALGVAAADEAKHAEARAAAKAAASEEAARFVARMKAAEEAAARRATEQAAAIRAAEEAALSAVPPPPPPGFKGICKSSAALLSLHSNVVARRAASSASVGASAEPSAESISSPTLPPPLQSSPSSRSSVGNGSIPMPPPPPRGFSGICRTSVGSSPLPPPLPSSHSSAGDVSASASVGASAEPSAESISSPPLPPPLQSSPSSRSSVGNGSIPMPPPPPRGSSGICRTSVGSSPLPPPLPSSHSSAGDVSAGGMPSEGALPSPPPQGFSALCEMSTFSSMSDNEDEPSPPSDLPPPLPPPLPDRTSSSGLVEPTPPRPPFIGNGDFPRRYSDMI